MTDAEEPVRYIERTRHYYRALGYAQDYVWARHDKVPFTRLRQPLAASRIALITTASPPGLEGIKKVWSRPAVPPPQSLFTANLAWDKESTHTEDRASFMPIEAVSELAAEGLFAALTPSIHGVPTEYSQRKTTEEDAPQVLERLLDDGADAAILCPL